MDKNTIIGFALIAAVLFGFTWFNQPSAEDVEAQRISDSIAIENQKKKEQAEIAEIQRQAAAAKAMAEDSTALFFDNLKGTERRVTLENEKVALTFNTKGAAVEKVVIKNFEDLNGAKDLTLFDKTNQSLNFILTTKEQNISTKALYFNVKEFSADGNKLVFIAGDEAGKNITVTYTLSKDYLLSCSVLANGMSGLFSPNTTTMDIDWQERCKQQTAFHMDWVTGCRRVRACRGSGAGSRNCRGSSSPRWHSRRRPDCPRGCSRSSPPY